MADRKKGKLREFLPESIHFFVTKKQALLSKMKGQEWTRGLKDTNYAHIGELLSSTERPSVRIIRGRKANKHMSTDDRQKSAA